MIKVKECLFLDDTVLLKEVERESEQSGMIIPQNTSEDQFLHAEVIWVGLEVEHCRIGHHVLYKRSGPTPVIIEGVSYLIAKESLHVESITDGIKDGNDLNSLIIKAQAKKLSKEFIHEISELMPGIVDVFKSVLEKNTKNN